MLASRRWRDWNPPEELLESPEHEPTKPTKHSSEPFLSFLAVPVLDKSRTFGAPASGPPCDPAEWRRSFARWLDSECVRSPRCFGGVVPLHIAYCEWEVRHDGVPCTRETFEQLLAEQGFRVSDLNGVVLVSGMTFREDYEACL